LSRFLKSTTTMSRLLLAAVPTDLLRLVQVRLASTTTTRFPFPTHPRPTPHQIFHLAPNASQSDIKARCKLFLAQYRIFIYSLIHLFVYLDYDLVRVHHPDSPFCRNLPPAERHARFQSISAAYDVLRGVKSHDDAFSHELDRRRRARRRTHRHPVEPDEFLRYSKTWTEESPDDRWKDRIIVCIGIFVRFIVL
jgi:hypothetical protein